MEPETPADWIRQGHAAEAHGTEDALAQAVRSYERAISLLQALPAAQAQRDLAIAWMNLGNARQKQPDAAASVDAVNAYDRTIALLDAIVSPENFELRNARGAAWMNRGHALQRRRTNDDTAAAIYSFDQAITQLQPLPLDDERSFRINLAAVWLNRAQALLSFSSPDLVFAHQAAGSALQVTSQTVRTDPVAADIALKAHHALSFILSQKLASGATKPLIAEAGDTIDEALALIRHWEQQGLQNFRPLSVALFRFGAHFYLTHQPQFLGEFLMETLDHARSVGGPSDLAHLQTVAASAIAQAKADAYNRSLFNPGDERLQQLRQDLEDAEKRLPEFRPPESTGIAETQTA